MTHCYLLQAVIHYLDGDEESDRVDVRNIAVYENEEEAYKAIDKDKTCDKMLEECEGEWELNYRVLRLPFNECSWTK